ncbi:MAG: prephenate dehydrogenase/arogenate dehydrogenase family protein, partial [Pseudomonadota bacterium]
MSVRFEKLALIGVGLIGASIAIGARRAGLVGEIVGTARTAETRETALRLGLIDKAVESPAEAVAGADLVILCVPVGATADVAHQIGPHLAPGCIVSDVGSVKGCVVEDLAAHLPETVHLVPGHPIAG